MFGREPLPLLFADAELPAIPLRDARQTALAARPVKARPVAPDRHRVCCNCPTVFPVRPGARKMFCSSSCESDYRNLMTVRGRLAMPLVMAARQTRDGTRGAAEQRKAGKRAASQLNQLLQDWRDEDRAAGRADAIDVFALRDRLGTAER